MGRGHVFEFIYGSALTDGTADYIRISKHPHDVGWHECMFKGMTEPMVWFGAPLLEKVGYITPVPADAFWHPVACKVREAFASLPPHLRELLGKPDLLIMAGEE